MSVVPAGVHDIFSFRMKIEQVGVFLKRQSVHIRPPHNRASRSPTLDDRYDAGLSHFLPNGQARPLQPVNYNLAGAFFLKGKLRVAVKVPPHGYQIIFASR
jgi:hypothetical protein